MTINSIMIGSENPQKLSEYYTKLFGKPMMEDGGYTSWQIGNSGLTVGAHDGVKGKNAHPGRVIWNIETSDVKGEFDRLKAAGAIVIQEPYRPSEAFDMWIATFADPDDNYWQIASPFQPEWAGQTSAD
jgi:predicted enzyme related to lactoylglutathione lyase